MGKALNRRTITARQKEGIYRDSGNEPVRGNRLKRHTKNERTQYGRSEDPEYRNMERSIRDARDNEEYELPGWLENDFEDTWNEDEKNNSGNGDRWSLRWRSRDDYERNRGQNKKNRLHDDLDIIHKWTREHYGDERYSDDERNRYGEHPASAGREEYLGGNKRHPGLVGNKSRYEEERYREDNLDLRDEIDRERQYLIRENERLQPRNHKNDTRLAIRDHLNRMQFGTPFHPMQMYDPETSERERERMAEDRSDDHIYRYEGYGHAGNTEGFGKRGGRQQGHDWLEEDEYREGHAPRQRGYGKYGSR